MASQGILRSLQVLRQAEHHSLCSVQACLSSCSSFPSFLVDMQPVVEVRAECTFTRYYALI
eukprot:6139296-Pleurochrysis_carterae.AAC.1